MMLSSQIASNIVREVNSVIPMKINIMNEKGIIIASSNPARIGSFHEGAYQIVENQAEEVTVRYDGEYNGALQGINYPLKLENYIIGVLGITGKCEEIAERALIVKRITELLLENTYSLEQKQLQESVCNRYLAEWLSGDAKNITADFVERGRMLGIDITIPRRIIVCSFYQEDRGSDLKTMQIIEETEKYLKRRVQQLDPINLCYKYGSTLVCAVTSLTDEEVENMANELKKQIEDIFPIKIAVGIDSRADSYTFVQAAMIQAQKANQACMRTHKRDIRFYDDLNMEVFTDEISELTKIEFIHRIFRNFTDEEIRNTMILLEVYYDLEGSINKTADHLFVHKNTLQFKLRKIAERTGYDPRSIRHSSLFYIAIYFYRDIYGGTQNA